MDKTVGFRLKAECLRAKTPSQEENLELVRRIQNNDSDAASEFILRNGKLVVDAISKYYPLQKDSEDAFQAGLMGLLKSAKSFDLSMDTSISTYAYIWVRQSVGRYIANNENDIRIPIHSYSDLVKIKIVMKEYESENSDLDIKDYIMKKTGFDKDTVDLLMPYVNGSLSLNSVVDNSDGTDTELADFIADENKGTEQRVIESIVKDDVMKVLMSVLNSKELEVIKYKYGLDGAVGSMEELMEVTGIHSRQGIQQCEIRVLRRLKHCPESASLRRLK